MSKESIRSLLEAKGSFPDEEDDIRASFEALFAMSQAQQESVDDLAWGFLLALDQWSHISGVFDPALAQRLRAWALSQWVTSPHECCMRLCALLVNVRSPHVVAFLKEQLEQSSDPDLQRGLRDVIADMAQSDGARTP